MEREQKGSKSFGFSVVTIAQPWAAEGQFEFGVVVCDDCRPGFDSAFPDGLFVHSKWGRTEEIEDRCRDQLAGPHCVRCGARAV